MGAGSRPADPYARVSSREPTMALLVQCPACGHDHRLSKKRKQKPVTCRLCHEVIDLPARPAPGDSLSPLAARAPKPRDREAIKTPPGNPSAAVDGSIPGAISGVLAGICVALTAGIFAGQPGGETVGGILLGFVIGFGAGALLGAGLGAVDRWLAPHGQAKSQVTWLASGGLVGGLVGLPVGGLAWTPLGGFAGAVGAYLWRVVCLRVEAQVDRPARLRLEEDQPAEAPLRRNR
jgi:hypothetical protein